MKKGERNVLSVNKGLLYETMRHKASITFQRQCKAIRAPLSFYTRISRICSWFVVDTASVLTLLFIKIGNMEKKEKGKNR